MDRARTIADAAPVSRKHGAAVRPLRSGAAARSRQIEADRRALAERALDVDGAAGLMREAMHLAETEAAARADVLGREEGVENARQNVGRDARTAVGECDDEIAAGDAEPRV